MAAFGTASVSGDEDIALERKVVFCQQISLRKYPQDERNYLFSTPHDPKNHLDFLITEVIL